MACQARNLTSDAVWLGQTSEISAMGVASIEKFGRIDVLINNAGYGLMGDFESIPDMEARKEFETNFWGTINMTREVVRVRVYREVKSGGQRRNRSSSQFDGRVHRLSGEYLLPC
jgi:NAD(P)-dependent dehydrogenase (short-subunit alcohol dehydrogenase family)